jgi:hypothetical protein
MGKFAEDLGEVQTEATIGAVGPEVSDAVGALEDGEGYRVLPEGGGDGEP